MSAKQDEGVGLSVNRERERAASVCAASAWAGALQAHAKEENGPTLLRLGQSQERGESGLELGCSGRIQGRAGKIFFSFSKLVFQTNF